MVKHLTLFLFLIFVANGPFWHAIARQADGKVQVEFWIGCETRYLRADFSYSIDLDYVEPQTGHVAAYRSFDDTIQYRTLQLGLKVAYSFLSR